MIARRESDPLTYLLDCSDTTLQDIALARTAKGAEMRKVLRDLLDEIVDELLDAELCRFVVENRSRIRSSHAVQIPLNLSSSQVTPAVIPKPRKATPKKCVNSAKQRHAVNVA